MKRSRNYSLWEMSLSFSGISIQCIGYSILFGLGVYWVSGVLFIFIKYNNQLIIHNCRLITIRIVKTGKKASLYFKIVITSIQMIIMSMKCPSFRTRIEISLIAIIICRSSCQHSSRNRIFCKRINRICSIVSWCSSLLGRLLRTRGIILSANMKKMMWKSYVHLWVEELIFFSFLFLVGSIPTKLVNRILNSNPNLRRRIIHFNRYYFMFIWKDKENSFQVSRINNFSLVN